MKGKMNYIDGSWFVNYIQRDSSNVIQNEVLISLPLHPEDINQIEEDSKIFDNIIGRILSYPDVEFNIIEECPHYNGKHFNKDCSCKTGFIQYAKIKNI
jgi:hypothetical protein